MPSQLLIAIFAVTIFLVMLKLFKSPIKKAFKLLINTALGFGALILIDLTSGLTGISIGVNLLNSLIVGILGLPGFGLLLMIRWLFI